MGGNWRERFARWMCRTFGHRTYIDQTSAGGGDPEICWRCNVLVSTAFSRNRGKSMNPAPDTGDGK